MPMGGRDKLDHLTRRSGANHPSHSNPSAMSVMGNGVDLPEDVAKSSNEGDSPTDAFLRR